MNNQDFRSLIESTSQPQSKAAPKTTQSTPAPQATGARLKPAFSLAPRSVQSSYHREFKRQRQDAQALPKFKSTAAPKGTKLASGYVDRAKLRAEAEAQEDERAQRIATLEARLKQGELTPAEFEAQRDAITNGSLDATHLVKGLDRRLLERVRQGEDVLAPASGAPQEDDPPSVDEDAVFDDLLQTEVKTVVRENQPKRGQVAPPVPVAGQKRSRNDLLKELRAQREAAAASKSTLGGRFKKIGSTAAAGPTPGSRIETDDRGREVLITVDEHGQVKRKVRKTPRGDTSAAALPQPDPAAEPLGMEVPPGVMPAKDQDDDDDGDIFADVGTDYNPLGDNTAAGDSDSDSASDHDDTASPPPPLPPTADALEDNSPEATALKDTAPEDSTSKDTTPKETTSTAPPKRSYFKQSTPPPTKPATLQDPTLLAALRRAAAERTAAAKAAADAAAQTQQRLQAQRDRDFEDMDMGFGGSRFDDDDDDDGGHVKLSEWGADDDGEGGKGGGKKRKRAPKKRKGDKNSAADVLGVIAAREKKHE